MDSLIQVSLGFIVIPWIVWVSTSIFKQKEELALFKQELERTHTSLRDSMNTLIDIFRPPSKKKR